MTGVSFADSPPTQPGPEAVKTASGLAHQLLKEGTGDVKPVATDMVTVHYTGWMSNGRMFDDSVSRGQPVTFPLNRIIKGWTEGLRLMTLVRNAVSGFHKLWPMEISQLGAPQGDLIFDIELLAIKQPKPEPQVPENLSAAPEDAQTHDSGLRSVVLKPGTGDAKPKSRSKLKCIIPDGTQRVTWSIVLSCVMSH